MKKLTTNLEKIMASFGGTWGVMIKDLDTNEQWGFYEKDEFIAASIIKVPIMIATYEAFDEGNMSPSDEILLKREDLVGGSGVLQHMTPGTKLTVYDLVVLMIIQSDNTATNMLIDLLGKGAIQNSMKANGCEQSQFFNKLMTVPVKREGNNTIIAQEMAMLLEKLVKGEIISVYASEQMIDILKKQQIRESLAGKLPEQDSSFIGVRPEWELANKTGNISRVRHDIGIFYVNDRTMVASALSKDIDDYQSICAFQDIGLGIVNYLNGD